MTDQLQLRHWQQIKQAQALEYAGTPEGNAAMIESNRYGLAADRIDKMAAQVEVLRVALSEVTRYAELQVCTHEETHRGGAIWEICESCGASWADDRGGKPKFREDKAITSARAALALPSHAAAILRQRDAKNGSRELRRGARVIELFDDATMKGDYMLDSSDCASILNTLADELERKNG